MPAFEVVGLSPNYVDYLQAWELQRAVHADVVSGAREDTVLLLEHDSVYTAGKRTEDEERPEDGTPVIDVDRGGKITWHGPGQLVGYPIMKLPDPIDVVGYVRWLEQVLIDSIAEFGLKTERVEGRSGVWAPVGDTHVKIAAIGIRVAEKVTMHGFALNCNNSLNPYETIIACGIKDAATSTISELLQQNITPEMAAEVIQRRLIEIGK
ncbi:MAG: lipoyl(octanoyl) transferase LipB [Micrococcales bacterium]|jgi:lipoyl(octanoyl) transferase|nr:lipoyl(octanoyl) transferase LipB [Microbacteriaceae bacterium]NBR23705.1 lipoyl(octanoyl) transferase LipB [Micrococcales bacterium]NBX94420.1 lipoyl(octanoyl) transferase LipB [Actinomycetota bacterium]